MPIDIKDSKLSYAERQTLLNQLVKEIIKVLKKKNISFKNLIRNYATNIMDIRDPIFAKASIDVNDWLNDQYTLQQSDIIVNELTTKIAGFEL